jgi:hypothetical protein
MDAFQLHSDLFLSGIERIVVVSVFFAVFGGEEAVLKSLEPDIAQGIDGLLSTPPFGTCAIRLCG